MNTSQNLSVINRIRSLRRFGRQCALAAILSMWAPARAGVVLQPGTTIEFATLQEGRAVLGTRDEFIQMMSQFDRCVRMKTSAAVTEAQFLVYIQNQVQTWSAAEQVKLSNIVGSIKGSLNSLNVALPSTVWLIKTSGREEANAAYCRGNAIIFPQAMVSGSSNTLRNTFTHELFHIHSHHRPDLRPALYGVVGFQACPAVALPQSLLDIKITNPDACHHDFVIRVKLGEDRVPVVPVLYSTSAVYTGGELFSYLVSKLLVLEDTGTGLCPRLTDAGQPMVLDYWTVADFYEQIGYNTGYNIHPEETVADNFMQLVLGTTSVQSPRIHHLLRRALQSGSSAPPSLLAGRYTGSLSLPDGEPRVLETSTDLLNWQVWDAFTNITGDLEVCDPTAWLGGNRFFRAKTGELPLLQPGDTNNLTWISPGTFLMGSPTNEAGHYASLEGPQRLVTLTHGFWIGKFEVTQGEYQQVMGTNPSSFAGIWTRPVESLTWAEATNYCAQLTQQEQTAGRLPSGYAYRLPTEAEWEYAARAGTTNRYSFGDDSDYLECYERLWFFDNANSRPHPVGLMPANLWGLHDLHGNVMEWCQDWYGAYTAGAVADPQGPATGTRRIMRGGSWGSGPHDCRSAARNYMAPTSRYFATGFRIVLASTRP